MAVCDGQADGARHGWTCDGPGRERGRGGEGRGRDEEGTIKGCWRKCGEGGPGG